MYTFNLSPEDLKKRILVYNNPFIRVVGDQSGWITNNVIVDAFLYLDSLSVCSLVWSSLGATGVHKIFADHADFFGPEPPNSCVSRALTQPYTNKTTTDDFARALLDTGYNSITIVPVLTYSRLFIGFLRILSTPSSTHKLPFRHGSSPLFADVTNRLEEYDFRLEPVLIGRWAAHEITNSRTAFRSAALLIVLSIASLFKKAKVICWQRNFATETMSYCCGSDSVTDEIAQNITGSLRSGKYMFCHVARSGRAIILPNFPTGIPQYLMGDSWTPDTVFQSLKQCLGSEELAYFAVPLKADDVVIAVFAVLCDREDPAFVAAERYTSVLLAELSRTLGIESVKRATRLIEETVSRAYTNSHSFDFSTYSLELAKQIVTSLIPDANTEIEILPTSRSEGLMSQRPINNRPFDKLTLQISTPAPEAFSLASLYVNMSPAADFQLKLTGPIELISGSLFRSLMRQMHSVLRLTLLLKDSLPTQRREERQTRINLRMWTATHDLKNSMSTFTSEISRLKSTSIHGDHNDLVAATNAFCSKSKVLLSQWTKEIDTALKTQPYLARTDFRVAEAIRAAYRRAMTVMGSAVASSDLDLQGDTELVMFGLSDEIIYVLELLFMNVLEHFVRCTPNGQFPVVSVSIATRSRGAIFDIIISISDSCKERGAFQKTRTALRSDRTTLGGIIKPTIEKLLDGNVFATHGPLGDQTVSIQIILPSTAKLS